MFPSTCAHTVCELMGPPRSPEQTSSEQTGGQEFKSVLSPPGGATEAAGRSHLCRGPEALGGQPGGAGPVQVCKCSTARVRSQWSGLQKSAPGEEEGWRNSLTPLVLSLFLSVPVCLSLCSLPSPLPLCLTVSVSLQEGQGPSFPAVRPHWGRKLPRPTFLLGVYIPRWLLLHNPCQACGLTGRLRTLLFDLKGQGQNDPGNPS